MRNPQSKVLAQFSLKQLEAVDRLRAFGITVFPSAQDFIDLQRERIEDFAERIYNQEDQAKRDEIIMGYFAKESVRGRRGVLPLSHAQQVIKKHLKKNE